MRSLPHKAKQIELLIEIFPRDVFSTPSKKCDSIKNQKDCRDSKTVRQLSKVLTSKTVQDERERKEWHISYSSSLIKIQTRSHSLSLSHVSSLSSGIKRKEGNEWRNQSKVKAMQGNERTKERRRVKGVVRLLFLVWCCRYSFSFRRLHHLFHLILCSISFWFSYNHNKRTRDRH